MATPTVLSFTFQDDDGVKASAHFYLSYDGATKTVDSLIGDWLEMGGLIDAITGAVVLSGSIQIPLSPDASWKDDALTGHSVSDTVNLVMGNSATIYTDTFVVPAVRDTLIADGRVDVTASGAVDDLAQRLITARVNGNNVNSAGDDLTTFIAAFQGVRKHRKQLKARSLSRP
jgi:hypothetical protein